MYKTIESTIKFKFIMYNMDIWWTQNNNIKCAFILSVFQTMSGYKFVENKHSH